MEWKVLEGAGSRNWAVCPGFRVSSVLARLGPGLGSISSPSPVSGGASSFVVSPPSQHCLHQHSFYPLFSKWENDPTDLCWCPELGRGGQELLSGSRRECSCRKRRRNLQEQPGRDRRAKGRGELGRAGSGLAAPRDRDIPTQRDPGTALEAGGLGEGLGWHREHGELLARFPWQRLPAGASAPVCGDSGCLSPGKARAEGGRERSPGTPGMGGWTEGPLSPWGHCHRGAAAMESDGLRCFPGTRGGRDGQSGTPPSWGKPLPGLPACVTPKLCPAVPVSCRAAPGAQQLPLLALKGPRGLGSGQRFPSRPPMAPAPPWRRCRALMGVLLFPSGLSQESEEGSQPAWSDRRDKGARPKLHKRSLWQPGLPLL